MAGKSAETGKPKYPVKITEEANKKLDCFLYSRHRAMKSDSMTYAIRLLGAAVDAYPDLSVSEAARIAENRIATPAKV
jgi:hypothetical protein